MNKKNPLLSGRFQKVPNLSLPLSLPHLLLPILDGHLMCLGLPSLFPATTCQPLCTRTRAQLMVSDFVLSGREPMVSGLAAWQAT